MLVRFTVGTHAQDFRPVKIPSVIPVILYFIRSFYSLEPARVRRMGLVGFTACAADTELLRQKGAR